MKRLSASLMVVGLLTSCTQFSANTPGPSTQGTPAAAGKSVTMTMTAAGEEVFEPKSATFKVGDTVTIFNKDNMPHTFTAKDGSFDTGPIAGGSSATVNMKKKGQTEANCLLHPGMGMMITVE
jgi:plastocyanin